MEQLENAKKKLKTALDEQERVCGDIIREQDEMESELLKRLSVLNEKKKKRSAVEGNLDASDDDIIEINAGGKIVAARRGTLCRLKGTRLEALFSGRWDKKLQRDSRGRIFLDVNGDCFQAIVDYLNELSITSEDDPPKPSVVDDELESMLAQLMELFEVTVPAPPLIPGSDIITDSSDAKMIYQWLRENGSDGKLKLLYKCVENSFEGNACEVFHRSCDDKGRTLLLIKTERDHVVGGYSNIPWKRTGGYIDADKAFLFAISAPKISSPCKMKLKDAGDTYTIYRDENFGPTFGDEKRNHYLPDDVYLEIDGKRYFDLEVQMRDEYESDAWVFFGNRFSDQFFECECDSRIVDMEVFQTDQYMGKNDPPTVDRFVEEVNDAINEKWISLYELEGEIIHLERSFEGEEHFIESLASGDTKDVVVLNVSGTMMATKRATLMIVKDSMLAQQFDDKKWTEQKKSLSVKDWTPEDVINWAKNVEGIPEDTAALFLENGIKGVELLALDKDGLQLIGVKRAGTICLLLKEIKQLEQASQDVSTLIEHSPYCFGKILDRLRLKHLHCKKLINEPSFPSISIAQTERFERLVKYYFPGDSSMAVLTPQTERGL